MTKQTRAVAGFGRTGKALLRFLLHRNSNKSLYLYNDSPIPDSQEKKDFEAQGVTFLEGEAQFHKLAEVAMIILSPGVDGTADRFTDLRQKGIKIISEIELAFAFIEGKIIAITGTNGKSTTVSLIHHILKTAGIDSYLTGNIGNPLISEVENMTAQSVAVVEVSSFQLEEIVQFRPDIALMLNITPDHLDRYGTIDNYFSAKLNLVKNQLNSDYLILNADDPFLNRVQPRERFGQAGLRWFSRSCNDTSVAACIKDNQVMLNIFNGLDGTAELISLENNPLRGMHNLENILAAVTSARLMGVTPDIIENAIKGFTGLTHRMESAGKVGDVEFINDSKATNVDATLKSISGIDEPMVVILGGKDKGGDFTLLKEVITQRAERVLLVGHAAPIIREQLADMDELLQDVADFAEAIETGYAILKEKGGVVLLAPGCASFDMFDNFEHRGQVFKEEVSKLQRADVPNK